MSPLKPQPILVPKFLWWWFLGWTVFSCILIFAALRILTGMTPPEPFIIQPFAAVDFGRIVLLMLTAVTLVFVIYFLSAATLPRIGPYTSPAGNWLVVSLVLVIVMTALLIAGSLAWDKLAKLVHELQTFNLSHEMLATVLVISLTLALSTTTVVSNLAMSLRDCTDEQNQKIKSFLLWMHSLLTAIVLIYSVLLFKTNLRLSQFADGSFIWYFCIFYLMITVLIFVIPAAQYKIISNRVLLWSFAGFNAPPWLSSLISKTGIESYLPGFVTQIWKLI